MFTLSLEISTLSFGRLRQKILLTCVPHVQYDYFSSFNQSDPCFLALLLLLTSSWLKLPLDRARTATKCINVHKGNRHVQSVKNCRLSLSNVQICDDLVGSCSVLVVA